VTFFVTSNYTTCWDTTPLYVHVPLGFLPAGSRRCRVFNRHCGAVLRAADQMM
jgi:hypothetical protein